MAALERLVEPGARVPPNVVAQAARTLLEATGALKRSKAQPDQEVEALDLDPEAMTLEDIEQEILRTGRV